VPDNRNTDRTAIWNGGTLVQLPGDQSGDHWFVDSNAGVSGNTGKSWDNAVATIDQAVNKAAAGADTIWVHPAHAEALAADSAVDIDKAGITVRGVRRGRLMPTLNVTAAAGDIKLAAAGVSIHDLRVTGGIDVITGAIEVSGADCAIVDCEYRDVTGQATDVIITTAAADRLLIDGYRHLGAAAAGGNSAIAIVGADDVEIRNFYLHGNFAVGAIDFRTTLSARVHVHDGDIWNTNASVIGIIDTITSSTGQIGPNIDIRLLTDAANITEAVTGATFHLYDPVYVVNAVDEKGLLINWTASSD
jgi:hypothetical protein